MATHLMIKKTMTITSLAILVAAISVAATMTLVQADPTDDDVVITVPQATQDGATLPVADPPEYGGEINGDASFPISVDIDAGFVWVLVPSGDPNGLIQVHIEDIDWTGLGPTEDGAIIALSCEIEIDGASGVPLPSAVFTRDSIWITVDTSGFLKTEFDVHCTFNAVHGDLEKTTDCPAEIEIKEIGETECTFTITYAGAAANLKDTVPAEWEVTDVDDSADTCSSVVKGNSGKGATKINCLDVTSVDTIVTIETRESPDTQKHPNKAKKFKPTSCDLLPINNGVVAIAVDGGGNPIIGTMDGLPIVIVETDPLPPITVIANADPFFECEE